MVIRVALDDLSTVEVQALVAGHLAAMHGSSPPGHVNALALEGLQADGVSFWVATMDGALCGCGALQELDPTTGELKSMHTLPAFQRQGVAQAVLATILAAAQERGYHRVYLETGTGPAFDAAHAFYARHGFEGCSAFADYEDTAFNAFMVKELATTPGVAMHNEFGQPVGTQVQTPLPVPRPARTVLTGQSCTVEPLQPAHAAELIAAETDPSDPRSWTYMAYGPFATVEAYAAWIEDFASDDDPLFFAIRDHAQEQVLGVASYLRIEPSLGSIEVGHIHYSPRLQRTRAATEAMVLMMQHAFELGYRRYEWKCDALNEASRRAAQRLGFRFEGVHRQHVVVRGRNRDTAWYSMLDTEWPTRRAAFESWLDPDNFDAQGRQRSPLRQQP